MFEVLAECFPEELSIGLVELLGGPPTPGIGFGSGIERVLLACDAEGVFDAPASTLDVFVVDVAGGQANGLADEVRRAAGGQHVRAVHLEPEFGELEWTVRLHPVWWTWYVDGDGVVRQLLVDGVSGRTRGPVMASTRQAWAWAAGIATAAVALLGLGLVVAVGGLLFPPALAVAALIGGLGVVVLAAALAPVVSVWSWNQRQRRI